MLEAHFSAQAPGVLKGEPLTLEHGRYSASTLRRLAPTEAARRTLAMPGGLAISFSCRIHGSPSSASTARARQAWYRLSTAFANHAVVSSRCSLGDFSVTSGSRAYAGVFRFFSA